MSIVTRAGKGTPLTHNEIDNNFEELRDIPTGKIFPKTSGIGIKVDVSVPTWGWRDLIGVINIGGGTSPTHNIYRGTIRQYQFTVGDEVYIEFHIPHDYAPGTHIYAHVHWSHSSATVSSGGITWGFEATYAKGHNQETFISPVTITAAQTASTTQYQHMIAETALSSTGGGGGLLDTDGIEIDGVILTRVYLSANTMTGTPEPFFHTADIHYQSTNLATKEKAPDFYV